MLSALAPQRLAAGASILATFSSAALKSDVAKDQMYVESRTDASTAGSNAYTHEKVRVSNPGLTRARSV